jgi:ComF family protein
MLKHTFSKLLDWIAPDSCAACQQTLARNSELYCPSCASTSATTLRLRWLGRTPALAIGSYTGALEIAIKRFKYEARPELARRFGRALSNATLPSEAHGDFIAARQSLHGAFFVPVPLHPERLAERGYNQAALLTKAVARELNCPTALRALVRLRHTEKQSLLSRELRLANVAHNFALRRPMRARVVLVDDVLTTGATLLACEAALRAAGVEVSAMLTLAQAD